MPAKPKPKRVLKENAIKPTAKSKTPVYTSKELKEKRKKFMFTNSKGKTSRYGDI
jgi:hypothetical protein